MQSKEYNFHPLYLFCICALLIIGACNPIVYLGDNESLLIENKIRFKDRKATEARSVLKAELALNYKQRPNKEFLFIPREWYYYRFQNSSDTSFLATWIKKNVAEFPSVHDSLSMEETAAAMQRFLRKDKGYYNAKVSTKSKIKDKEATITYIVETDKQFSVRSLSYNCEDSSLVDIINNLEQKTLIPVGKGVTRSNFNAEESRLVTALQDLGYARFNSNYVNFQGDTSNYGIDVIVNVLSPGQGLTHTKFSVGKITVVTDYSTDQDTSYEAQMELKSIDYLSNSGDFFVSPKTLGRRIFLEEGSVYQRSKELRTAQNLSNLNAYRFVSLNPTIDDQLDSIINYNFQLSPITNKWVSERNGSVYYANLQRADNSQFLGLALSTNLSSRNLLQNAESFNVGLDGFVEFNLNSINSIGASFDTGLSQPRLYDITKLLYFANAINLLPEKTYESLNDNTTTDLTFSYSYSFTALIYGRASINAKFGYNYRPNVNTSILYNQIGLNYLLLNPLESFQVILAENPYFANSFNKRLLTGVFFNDFSYVYNSTPSPRGFTWGLTYFMETSGIELSLLNSAYNLATSSENIWNLPLANNDEIEFAKFFKLDIDHHFNQKIYGTHSIAGRFRTGVALPFGGSESVPFVRQFAVGGQNSIRGWQIRSLGPGGYDISKDPDAILDTQPYQTGDFILESSVEYRFPVSGFLRGAVFVDAGNVWTLSDADLRSNSQLTGQFYNQIAVASGLGVRMDFSYFLLRFDFGWKIRNPFPNEAGSYWNYSTFGFRNISDANLSFGVNLPF